MYLKIFLAKFFSYIFNPFPNIWTKLKSYGHTFFTTMIKDKTSPLKRDEKTIYLFLGTLNL